MSRFNYILSVILACVLGTLCVQAETGSHLLARADSAYANGDYAAAVKYYNEVLAQDGSSPELYYNLGNSYSKGGDYGHALLSYMKGQRLDPSNKKIKNNIEFIRYKVNEANKSELRGKKYSLDPEPTPFLSALKKNIAADHSSDFWALWSAVAFILFVGAIAAYVFTANVLLRKIGFFGGFAFLGISCITLIFSFMAASYRSVEGVVVEPKVKLHTEASLSSKEVPVALTRGTCMKVLDTYPAGDSIPQWYKVKLNSDFIGWIQSSDFEPLEK